MDRKIILKADVTVGCPKCGHEFALQEGISTQTIDQYADEFDKTLATRGKALEAELAAEAKRNAEAVTKTTIGALRDQVAEKDRAIAQSKEQIEKVRTEAKASAQQEMDAELKSLREAVQAKDAAIGKSTEQEITLRRQLREAQEAKNNAELNAQRKLDEDRKAIEENARKTAGEEFARKEAQYKTQLESAQSKATDLQRKLDQASQQTQGEALELSLEEMLRSEFPADEIVPVAKGRAGADVEQRVRSQSGQRCGTILWEAKDTRHWQDSWLTKLKDNQREIGADFAVIVTAAMPKDVTEPFIRRDTVFVVRVIAARPVAEMLRVALLELHRARQASAGKGEAMELIYNYVCSPQFAQRLKAVVDSFTAMRKDLESEKAAMAKLWAKRDKQLIRMTGEMVAVVGDLQGLGGSALGQLESIAALPGPSEKDDLADL